MRDSFLRELQATIDSLDFKAVSEEREPVLHLLVDYIQSKLQADQPIQLNFICTHNSRRSQFSQLWAQVAAHAFDIPAMCFSGGTEATAFNERAVASIQRAGFQVTQSGTDNPLYQVTFAEKTTPLSMFSKKYDDPSSSNSGFAAIMTCSDADENCPYIPGAEKRIPLRYEDPKAFDDTEEEAVKYDERSLQIATELLYVFSNIKA